MKPAAWLLPAACALLPAIAAHAAFAISRAEGFVPDCIPYLEGCTSISRAGRHGTANIVFKSLMLPAALLQAWHWRECSRWLEARGGPRAGRLLAGCGLVAGVALAVYASFLGTEGAIYGWLRRYGITFYFGATFLAMALFLKRLLELRIQIGLARALAGLCFAMLLLGLVNTFAQLFATKRSLEPLRDAMEWQLGALFTAWFLGYAVLLARSREPS